MNKYEQRRLALGLFFTVLFAICLAPFSGTVFFLAALVWVPFIIWWVFSTPSVTLRRKKAWWE